MSLTPSILADRLEAAARRLSVEDCQLAEACEEAAAFFREEFDVPPQETSQPKVANANRPDRGRR